MALTLRPTDLERSPATAHLEDWIVLDDGKPIGRIYQRTNRRIAEDRLPGRSASIEATSFDKDIRRTPALS
jgi:hypothetical protein